MESSDVSSSRSCRLLLLKLDGRVVATGGAKLLTEAGNVHERR